MPSACGGRGDGAADLLRMQRAGGAEAALQWRDAMPLRRGGGG